MENLEELSKSELIAIINKLFKRVEQLESQLKKNSNNSSKPPSSDPLWDRSSRKKKRSNFQRKPGGQKGHKGHNLKKYEQLDHVIEHRKELCPTCQSSSLHELGCKTRQILDIPPIKMEVTEHRFFEYQCSCCKNKCIDEKINQLTQAIQYGNRIKSLVSYLNVYQLIPYKRLVDLIQSLCNHKISQGSISNFSQQISDGLGDFIGQLKESFTENDQIVHSDETGVIVNGQLKWTHVYSTKQKTYLAIHDKRGHQAIDEIGILPMMEGTLIHDRFGPYFKYENVKHGLCNAHLLRNIKAAQELSHKPWLEEIQKILTRSNKSKNKNTLKKNSAKFWLNKFENILREQRQCYQNIDANLKKETGNRSLDHRLFNALWKHRHKILLFLEDLDVPFDNNQAERDLRMLKVKIKVSNIFKSNHWAQVHLNIRSYISTLQKNNMDILNGLNQIQMNPKFANHLAV